MMLHHELRSRVLDAVRREPAPTRAQARLREGLWLVSSVVAMAALFWAYGGIRLAPRPWSLLAATVLPAALVTVVALRRALSPASSSRSPRRPELLAILLGTPLLLMAWKMGISSTFEGMVRQWPERPGFRCLSLSAAALVAPLVGFFMARRGTLLTHAALRGAAAGTALGAAIWVVVDLNCPVAYGPHLVLGHLLPLLASATIGASLAWPLLAVRAR